MSTRIVIRLNSGPGQALIRTQDIILVVPTDTGSRIYLDPELHDPSELDTPESFSSLSVRLV